MIVDIRRNDNKSCDKVCQWLATDRGFSPVSSHNKTDRHDIPEILVKVALNAITIIPMTWLYIYVQSNLI